MSRLLLFQKVNHFPCNKNLGRKDLLKKNFARISQYSTQIAQLFDILPATYLLPKESSSFAERFYADLQAEGSYNIWIIKPVGKLARASRVPCLWVVPWCGCLRVGALVWVP